MTVSTELSHEEYTGNGVTTDFDFRFRIFEAKHLVVSVADPDGTERILTNGTDYTLRGVGSYRGGKVILKMPLATGWKIGIARDLPAVQETDLRNQGKFFAEVHEDAFDYLTMLIQKSLGFLSLCLRKPSFISDHYDAKGNKISNLGKPVKDGDAVNLGTMKDLISAKDKRSLRVADKDIPALPGTSVRRNKQLGFDNNGMPLLLDPAETGVLGYVLVDSFEKGAVITSRYQALHWLHNGEYYRWDGALPKTVPAEATPDSAGGVGVGAWVSIGDSNLRTILKSYGFGYQTVADIPASAEIGSTVRTLGRYQSHVGPGEYIIMAGVSPYPAVDPQISDDRYAKLLPARGTSSSFSLLASGGKGDLTIDGTNSAVINQLFEKIMHESPVVGGNILAEAGMYFITSSIVSPFPTAKHIGIIGEKSNTSPGTFESKTIFYFGNDLVGDYCIDMLGSQFVTLTDIALRGDVNSTPTKGGIRLGVLGEFRAGYGSHLIERVQAAYCSDGILLKNAGITTLRDIVATSCHNRGVALETSGDSNLYNIYANDCDKDTDNLSLSSGCGVYIGIGSSNTNIFGGKIEFNSKGLVSHGTGGLNIIGIQFDYNKMANLIIESIDDNVYACRSNSVSCCRFLSGGVRAGYAFSSIYVSSRLGSTSVSISGGSIQAAGNGAFDTSTSGDIGATVGVYADGNDTFDISIIGDGITMLSPGTSHAAVAKGVGSQIYLYGSGQKKSTLEIDGGKCLVGFNKKGNGIVSILAGSAQSITYAARQCDYMVSNGIAEMDIYIQLSSAVGLTGDIFIADLPFSYTGSAQGTASFSMVAGVKNTEYGLLGYVVPGDNKITLWRKRQDGYVDRLTAADITGESLFRLSVKMRVA